MCILFFCKILFKISEINKRSNIVTFDSEFKNKLILSLILSYLINEIIISNALFSKVKFIF